MGVIWAKFRKEKSTQEVLEALQEKIEALEAFTVNTQEQKRRIVGNLVAVSIGLYVIAFALFYFLYFPPTWKERLVYFIPLLLFPIIIFFLRYSFNWYYQRKLNKNSKKLTALRGEKKKILEQVMDKETYKVAVNLLARFADKPSKTSFSLSSPASSKYNQPLLNRSLPVGASTQGSKQLALTSTPTLRTTSNYISSTTPRITAQMSTSTSSPTTALMPHSGLNQQLRHRTPFPIVNQRDKGVFDRIVDVIIGDGPQDRFAMICKECYSHNGMALKEDFEYTTFKCAFCNALNPARKSRPVAPRLSVMPGSIATAGSSDSSDSEDDKDSEDERAISLKLNTTQFSTPTNNITNLEDETKDAVTASSPLSVSSSDSDDEGKQKATNEPQSGGLTKETEDESKKLEKSDSAIEDTTMSPE